MSCFKQNERTKCEKNDPARTRTWNLLIRSQTPYPLGHKVDKLYIEFYYYFTINCITNMHCNTVILCLHLDFYSFVVPDLATEREPQLTMARAYQTTGLTK